MLDKTSKIPGKISRKSSAKSRGGAKAKAARARRPKDSPGPLERVVRLREEKAWAALRHPHEAMSGGEAKPAGKDLLRPRLLFMDLLKEDGHRFPGAQHVGAKLALARAFDSVKGLAKAIRSGKPVVVVVDVPDPLALDHIEDCWREVVFGAGSRELASRDLKATDSAGRGSEPHAIFLVVREVPKARATDPRRRAALAALNSARPVILFSPDGRSHLPDVLLRADTKLLVVGTLEPRLISDVITIVTGETPDHPLEPAAAATIGLAELSIAVRFDRTATECMSRLHKLVPVKQSSADARDLTLDQMHGMDAGVEWARAFVHDVNSYRRGEIPFSAISAGVCLEGPSGTGKTTLAKVVAREAGCEMVVGGFAKWIAHKEGHLGDFTSAMAKDFAVARAKAQAADAAKIANVVIFYLDEIDSFVDRDSLDGTNGKAWVVGAVNALLAAMDSISGSGEAGDGADGRSHQRPPIVFIASTNNSSRCDPAVLRAGRFNRVIRIELPDADALEQMMRVRLKGELAGEDLSDLALMATGMTGADVESRVNEARRFARHDKRDVTLADLNRAFLGETLDLSHAQRARIAVHEASHLLADVLLDGPDGALATMAIRKDRLAAAFRARNLDDFMGTFDEHFQRLQVLLAGRIGEAETYGGPSQGAGGSIGSDLQQATSLACAMVASIGLSGPPVFLAPFTDTQRLLEFPEIRVAAVKLLVRAEESCRQLIVTHRAALDECAAILAADGRIDGETVARIVAAHEPATVPETIDIDASGISAAPQKKDPA